MCLEDKLTLINCLYEQLWKLILFMWNVINDQYYYTLKESNVIQNKEEEVHAIDKIYCTQTIVVFLLFRKTSWILYFLV